MNMKHLNIVVALARTTLSGFYDIIGEESYEKFSATHVRLFLLYLNQTQNTKINLMYILCSLRKKYNVMKNNVLNRSKLLKSCYDNL